MLPLFIIGLNHESATIELREQFAFAPETVIMALKRLLSETPADEAAILSTCNRTELYISGDYESLCDSLPSWLADYHKVDLAELTNICYIYHGDAALVHIMKVAAGLDSMVLGEPQILGQIKSSYVVAQEADALGAELHGVFQKVFSAAKKVRTDTAIGRSPVSVAYAAVNLAQRIFADIRQNTALLIGAGETIDLAARHLSDKGIGNMVFANRTLARAESLANTFSAQAVLLSDIPDALSRADIVISSTASQLPVLGKGAVESALKVRKHKPIFMVDIAVPRDIEPEVGELSDVYLYTVDSLRDIIDEGKQARENAATEAHGIVKRCVDDYIRERRARYSIAAIKSYRQYAESLRDEVLAKALRDLNNGSDAEQVLQRMAKSLTNKLLHAPTQQLKQAGEEGQHELLELSQQLLGLSQIESKNTQ